MPKFRRRPGDIEAHQFDGRNWAEMMAFVGNRKTQDGKEVPGFLPIGTLFAVFAGRTPNERAELWVEANQTTVPIEIGEWVLQDEKGFYPCKDDIFQKLYESAEEA